MKTAIYSVHKFERDHLLHANNNKHELIMIEETLSLETVRLAAGCEAICIFVNDKTTALVIDQLYDAGIQCIALRSAGYNHVDIAAATSRGIRLARVPEYSPYSVAEHATALILALNRQLIHAHNRIKEQDFSLDGLTGFDLHGKTVGILGTGKIGRQFARIMHGFGCKILAYDAEENEALKTSTGVSYVDLHALFDQSDIISIHLPLDKETKYIINQESIARMKKGVMVINTSRGGLVNSVDMVAALKSGQVGYLGMDVYEEEDGLFFEDHSEDILQDDVFARLTTFRNVLITSHQAFLTETSLKNIAETTIYNLDCFEQDILSGNEIGISG